MSLFKQQGTGDIDVTFYNIIPLVFFISKCVVTGKTGRGICWSIHVTPFFAFGFVWPEGLMKAIFS